MAGEVCSAFCDSCKGNFRSKHVHIAGWYTYHTGRCEFLKQWVWVAPHVFAWHVTLVFWEALGYLWMINSLSTISHACARDVQSTKCCIPGCTVEAHILKYSFSLDAVREVVADVVILQEHSSTLPLCMAHYLQLGRLSKPGKMGDIACKQTLIWRFVLCTEPHTVKAYLRESADTDSFLTASDMVCYSCYKYCKQILSSGVCLLSSDYIIKELTCKREYLQSLMHGRVADSTKSYIELGLNQTALYLC